MVDQATLEMQLESLESTLKAVDVDDDKNKKSARLAVVKQAMSEMDDEEKKQARKAFDMDDDEKEKKAKKSSDVDDEEKEKKAKKSSDVDDEEKEKKAKKSSDVDSEKDDLKEKIASLTASLSYVTAKPLIDKMLSARRTAGMAETDIVKFQNTLYGKSIGQIEERYNEDKDLYSKQLVASNGIDIPFNGSSLIASGEYADSSLEEMFN